MLTCRKQGMTVQNLVNTGLKTNKTLTFFFFLQMFLAAFLCIWRLLQVKSEGQTSIYRK